MLPVSGPDDGYGWRWNERDDWFAEPSAPEPHAGKSREAALPPPAPGETTWIEDVREASATPRQAIHTQLRRRRVSAAGAVVALLLLALWLAGTFGGGTPRRATRLRPQAAPVTTVPAARPPPAPAIPTTPLAPGSSGVQVRHLQRALARLGYSAGRIDGSYGPATVAALKRFQQASGLQADGVLGPRTLRALRLKLASG